MSRVSHEAMKQALKGALKSGVRSSEVKDALRSAGVRLSSYKSEGLKKHVSSEQVRKAFNALREEGMMKSGLNAGRFYERAKASEPAGVSHAKEMGKLYIKERAEEEAAAVAKSGKVAKAADAAKVSKVVEVKAVTTLQRPGGASKTVSSPTTSVVTSRPARPASASRPAAPPTPTPRPRPPPDLAID